MVCDHVSMKKFTGIDMTLKINYDKYDTCTGCGVSPIVVSVRVDQ